MPRYAKITDGLVENIIVADSEFAAEHGYIAAPAEVGIGWSHDGTTYTAPPAPPPPTIEERRASMKASRARFAVAAHVAGIVTAAEAEAWAGGTALPQIVTDAFAANIADPTERLAARIEALTTANVHRTNSLIVMLQADLGLTDAQADALFDRP